MKTSIEIRQIVESLLNDTELFVVDVKVSASNVIEVLIDSPKGVDIDRCISVNRQLEEALDREVEDFELTVASAGIGCPFKVPGQYLKNIGNEVEMLLADSRKLKGRLDAFDGSTIKVTVQEKQILEGKKRPVMVDVQKEIALTDIRQIKDVVEF